MTSSPSYNPLVQEQILFDLRCDDTYGVTTHSDGTILHSEEHDLSFLTTKSKMSTTLTNEE